MCWITSHVQFQTGLVFRMMQQVQHQRVSDLLYLVCNIVVCLENTYTHYESLDNLYDKSAATPSYMPQVHNKLVDDETEEEYMKMAPSRSCSHATIKSDTLRSSDSIKMSTLGHHDSTSHYNTLSSNYSHYDVPPSNLYHQPPPHSNHNHYDIPPNNKLASTK